MKVIFGKKTNNFGRVVKQQTFYRCNDFFVFLKPGKEYTSGKEDEIEAITSNPVQKPQLLQGKQV